MQTAGAVNVRDCGNLSAAVRFYFIDHQHRGRRMRLLEILADMLGQNGWSERAKWFPLFDSLVQQILHAGSSRIGKNGTIAQSTRPKFHSSLKPTNNLPICDIRCGLLH